MGELSSFCMEFLAGFMESKIKALSEITLANHDKQDGFMTADGYRVSQKRIYEIYNCRHYIYLNQN